MEASILDLQSSQKNSLYPKTKDPWAIILGTLDVEARIPRTRACTQDVSYQNKEICQMPGFFSTHYNRLCTFLVYKAPHMSFRAPARKPMVLVVEGT